MSPSAVHDPRTFYDSLDSMDAVARLIEPPLHESQTLEYKAAARPFDENERAGLAKEVCALANSSGGVIIYGITTARDDRTKPTGLSGFDVRNVELFDQTVATRIQKPVVGLERKVLPAEAPQVLIVFVPKSIYSPHQDTQVFRYFYRSGSVSRPMPHDLVELHFGRRLGPVLRLEVDTTTRTPGPPGHIALGLRLFLLNHGQRVGRSVEAIVWLSNPPLLSGLNVVSGYARRIDELHGNTPTLQFIENQNVFHPRMRRRILDLAVTLNTDFIAAHLDHPLIQWAIYADEMELQTDQRTLRDVGLAT